MLPTTSPCRRAFAPAILLATLSAIAAASAQTPPAPAAERSVPIAAGARAVAIPADALRVPLHSLGADRGVWTAGAGYKASFHDGFAFYPALGEEHPVHLPLRWTTESVTAAGVSLVDLRQSPAHARADWRYEYRWPGFTERYDVRADGVEQSFVIDARPAVAGELVVTGRVDTPLCAAAVPDGAHRALTFCDDGGYARVRYGEAWAVDACGARLALATSFDGERVRLVVPADHVASAVFPLVIDPLTSAVTVLGLGGIYDTRIVRHEETGTRNVMISFARRVTGTDDDVYALLVDDDFANPTLVLAEIDAARNVQSPSIAYVDDADRWIVTWLTYTVPGYDDHLRAYFHARDDRGLNSGTLRDLDPNPSRGHKHPRVSAPVAGTRALLVWGTGGNLGEYDAWAGLLDARTMTLVSVYRLNPTTHAGFMAAIASRPGPQERSWVVTWDGISRSDALDDWDAYVTRIDPNAFGFGISFEVPDASTTLHEHDLAIDGRDGRYLIAAKRGTVPYRGRPTQTVVTRVDWPETVAFPTFGASRVLDEQPDSTSDLNLAFDSDSRSHWYLGYRRVGLLVTVLRKLGYSGGVVEEFVTDSSGGIGGLYHAASREFRVAYGYGSGLVAQRIVHPADALSVRVGQGCQQSSLTFGTDLPLAGSEFFGIRFGGIGDGNACVLLLSFAPASIPLDGYGLTGCVLGVDPASPNFLVSIPRVSASGGITVTLPLPDAPVFRGDVFAQWLYQARPDANPAGWLLSWPLRIQIR